MSEAEPRFPPLPGRGRRYAHRRRVRLGDVAESGRLHLDAIARYLQDVAGDDVDDAGIEGAWVVRRTALRIDRLPRYNDDVELVTFCSGTGSHWAERRTTLNVEDCPAVEAVAIWVHVDRAGRPARLGDSFFELYGEAANGRRVTGRLHLPSPPRHADRRPWPLRSTDLDLLGHVNNAVYWQAVEDELRHRSAGRRVTLAELEHRVALGADDRPEVASALAGDALSVWLTTAGGVHAAANLRLTGSARRRGGRAASPGEAG